MTGTQTGARMHRSALTVLCLLAWTMLASARALTPSTAACPALPELRESTPARALRHAEQTTPELAHRPDHDGPAAGILSCDPCSETGGTRIRFRVVQAGQVTLTLYSDDGRLLRTLVNRPLAEGLHEELLGSQTLAPGKYLLELACRHRHQRCRLLLVK